MSQADDRKHRIGFGCAGIGNEFGIVDHDEALDVVRGAIELGITYFDTSPYYGRTLSETRLGEALAGRRDETFIATKAGRNGKDPTSGFDFSYDGIISSCEMSLRRLRTDRIDLLQLHDIEFGRKRQIEDEAIPALLDLRAEGKTRFIGVTGYPVPLLADIVGSHPLDYVLSYCHYTLINRQLESKLRSVAESRSTSIVNASVLHMGLLTDSGPPEWHPADKNLARLAGEAARFCREAGSDLSDLALRFALQPDWIDTTLIGPTKLSHLQRALEAAADPPDPELLAGVLEILAPRRDATWASGRYDATGQSLDPTESWTTARE